MGRIASAFRRLAKVNEAALVPYVPIGYPSLDITRQLVPVIARQGADLIELGVPLSDPAAGGANTSEPSPGAQEGGVSLDDCLSVAAEARRANEIPLLFMSYYNPIQSYGLEEFAAQSADSGIDGLVIPDLPPEEAHALKTACEAANIDLVLPVAPSSTDDRLKLVTELAGGFIYCACFTGPTGAGDAPGDEAARLVARVRGYTDLPLVAGYGITTAEQVTQAAGFADGVVVGSSLIALMEGLPEEEIMLDVAGYVRALKEATVKTST
jgi:tryptophan synthase alpha chain